MRSSFSVGGGRTTAKDRRPALGSSHTVTNVYHPEYPRARNGPYHVRTLCYERVSGFKKNSRLTLDDYYIDGGVIFPERREHWSFGRTIDIYKIHPPRVGIDFFRLLMSEGMFPYSLIHGRTAKIYSIYNVWNKIASSNSLLPKYVW